MNQEADVQLVARLQGYISQQLRVLRQVGIVSARQDGQNAFISSAMRKRDICWKSCWDRQHRRYHDQGAPVCWIRQRPGTILILTKHSLF